MWWGSLNFSYNKCWSELCNLNLVSKARRACTSKNSYSFKLWKCIPKKRNIVLNTTKLTKKHKAKDLHQHCRVLVFLLRLKLFPSLTEKLFLGEFRNSFLLSVCGVFVKWFESSACVLWMFYVDWLEISCDVFYSIGEKSSSY